MSGKKVFKSKKMCCVPQCSNRCSEGVSLHVFPTTETLREKWRNILGIGKAITPFSAVCSTHFKTEDFHFPRYPMSYRKRLKANAVPSQNIPKRSLDQPSARPVKKSQKARAVRELQGATKSLRMPCCVAVGCSNRDSRGFLMKRFPADPERRSIWAEKVGREDWEPRGSSYLCEVHFAPEMFEQHRADGKRLLKYNAIPTIFPPVPQKKTKKTPVKRPLSKTNTLETSVPVESDAVVAVETPTRNNKKKKQVLPKSSKKDKDHSPKREDDVITARARLTTTLQSLFPESSDDENDISDDEVWPKNLRTPDSSKRTIIDKHNDQDSKYVMKIFDRTIDLAQFNESTPLYPLCRAWIANQPYQMYNIKKESQNDEEEEHSKRPKDEFGFGTVELPRPEPMEKHAPSLRIPDIIPYKSVFNSFMKEGEEPPSKEDLLQDNLQHWLKIRKSWREASLCNEARYEKSIHLLTSMFKKHFIHDDEKFSDFSEGDHWGVYK